MAWRLLFLRPVFTPRPLLSLEAFPRKSSSRFRLSHRPRLYVHSVHFEQIRETPEGHSFSLDVRLLWNVYCRVWSNARNGDLDALEA